MRRSNPIQRMPYKATVVRAIDDMSVGMALEHIRKRNWYGFKMSFEGWSWVDVDYEMEDDFFESIKERQRRQLWRDFSTHPVGVLLRSPWELFLNVVSVVYSRVARLLKSNH